MLSYAYVAKNVNTGEQTKGEVEAEGEAAAARLLTERGLAPLEIKLKEEGNAFLGFRRKIPARHLVVFSRQLSTLVNSGLPVVQSLDAVAKQTGNKELKAIINRVITDVEAGSTLAVAMSRHPSAFDDVYTALVAAGETSGTLDVSLERLADQREKSAEITSKIRGAMFYPFLVIIVLIGVVTFLMTTVLPQVESLYAGIPGLTLPFITRILISASNFMVHFWWLFVVIIVGGGFIFGRWVRTTAGRYFLDGVKMRAVGIGPLFMKLYMARFSRVAATLVASGVPLIKVLSTTARSVGNVHIEQSVMRAEEQVKGGKTLSESLQNDHHFLDLVPNMIRTGEQSGQLDGMLGKLADYYEKEVDNEVKSISTVIEPILMIIVGIIALIIVAAVLLPIYSLAGKNLTPQ